MRSGVRWLRSGAFGLGIAVALAFGGFQALAGPTAMMPCDEVPPDFGPCYYTWECQQRCDNYYGEEEGYVGFCEWEPSQQQKCCICIAM